MRRALWYRTVATLLVAWFPLIIGEPVWLPPCPMHGAGELMGIMTQPDAGEPANGPGASQMHHHHATAASHAAGGSHENPAHGSGHHQCTCINCCGIGAAAVLQPSQALVAVAVADIGMTPAIRNVQSRPRPAPDFSRPFTTGPPRA